MSKVLQWLFDAVTHTRAFYAALTGFALGASILLSMDVTHAILTVAPVSVMLIVACIATNRHLRDADRLRQRHEIIKQRDNIRQKVAELRKK